jgi:hypothetical protein
MDIEMRFQQFVQAGLYLRGWSPKTASLYLQALACFLRFRQSLVEGTSDKTPTASPLTKAQLEAWLVWMRQQVRTAAGCNIYTCVFNSFCSWLNEQGLLKDKIKIKK